MIDRMADNLLTGRLNGVFEPFNGRISLTPVIP